MRHIDQSDFYQVRAINDTIGYGAVVSQLDVERLSNDKLKSDLYSLWIKEGVIVFEGVEGEDLHLDISAIFGQCILHPTKDLNIGVRAGLINLLYQPNTKNWLSNVDGELRGQYIPWHADLIYVDKINHGGILRPLSLPSRLGQTGFSDQIAAYDLLPQHLKEKIEDLHVIYHYDINIEHQRFGRVHDVSVMQHPDHMEKIIAEQDKFPKVTHPMVFTQQETGRKVLKVSPWFALGIKELPGKEGDDLLEEVVRYAIDDRVSYFHDWQYGQMVLWDNWRLLHCAVGAPADQQRHLQRTTIAGDYGLGRLYDGQEVNPSEYISV